MLSPDELSRLQAPVRYRVTEWGRVLLTNHVLSGALIGALARRPAAAFAAGMASHFVLDALPHWGNWGSTAPVPPGRRARRAGQPGSR